MDIDLSDREQSEGCECVVEFISTVGWQDLTKGWLTTWGVAVS